MKRKERPILMNQAMTVATLDGLKTQTRRICKNQNLPGAPRSFKAYELEDGRFGFSNGDEDFVCPYGRPGDRLYIRERTRLFEVDDGSYSVSGMVHGQKVKFKYESDGQVSDWLDYPTRLAMLHVGNCVSNGVYKEAARLWLEITNIRVERLHDITPEDAKAEGDKERSGRPEFHAFGPSCHIQWFSCLWESINGPGSWAKNPWVWVIEFKRVEL